MPNPSTITEAEQHALTATPDTGVHPLTDRVQALEAERRMSLFVAGYQPDDDRPLESLVSEALAQKDNRIAELEATLARTDCRTCPNCQHDWPHPSVTSGMLCPPCKYGPKLKKLEEEDVRLREKSELWKYRFLIARLAISAIAKDEALPCRCGHEPYTDGEQCPRCFAIYQYEWMREITDTQPAEPRAYLCPYCNQPVYPYSYHEGPEACQEALRQLAARESG